LRPRAGGDSDYADAGEFLFAIAATAEFDPWQTVPGDVTGDGSVTQADIDIILANMGKEGAHLTTFDLPRSPSHGPGGL
jgi:hypothetical protein